MPRHTLPRLALALALFAARGPLYAQQAASPRAPTRVPLTIVLMERLPQPGVPFLVQRRPDVAPYDVILLRSDASAEQLSEAISTLLVVRQAAGDTAATPGMVRIRREAQRQGARPAYPWVPRVLADLRRAAPREVAGIGTVPAVEIWLPRQYRRSTSEGVRHRTGAGSR